MGLAALLVLVALGIGIVVACVYGMCVGLARLAKLVWGAIQPETSAPRRLPDVRVGTGLVPAAQPIALQPCWDTRNCAPEAREKCPAYARKELPCWLANMQSAGKLKHECLTCSHFSMVSLMGAK